MIPTDDMICILSLKVFIVLELSITGDDLRDISQAIKGTIEGINEDAPCHGRPIIVNESCNWIHNPLINHTLNLFLTVFSILSCLKPQIWMPDGDKGDVTVSKLEGRVNMDVECHVDA